MATIKRSASLGRHLKVYGRLYDLSEDTRKKHGHLTIDVFVDPDGVIEVDNPTLGLYTAKTVTVYWPTRYDFLGIATLVR